MPRKVELSWQAGQDGRSGRWRKKYRGKTYYYAGGRGKTDVDAYQAALAAWEHQKQSVDAETRKPHQAEYEVEIRTWEQVLDWSRQYGEDAMANQAMARIKSLRSSLADSKPRPVTDADTFGGHFQPEVRHPERYESFDRLDAAVQASLVEELGEKDPAEPLVRIPKVMMQVPTDELVIEQRVWEDRLDVMSRTAIPAEKTLASHVESFLAQKKAAATAGELSANRVYILRLHLEHFRDWRAGESAVTDIDGKSLADYRLELLRRVESKEWSRTTANDRLTSVKSFVRWLWQIEAIPSLPRIIDSNTLRIGKQLPSVVTLTKPEISTLLKAASDRTKLYLLLMLNTGMTQKDIADLQLAEVDWEHGRITRKRSKTKRFSNVPIVTYTLWAETRRLLAQERNPADTGNVLLNQNGGPLWYEEVDDKGRLKKNDNIKNAFGRVARKQKITKPLKCLRKTSANLLRGSGTYASLAPVFLGHAPTAVADKHYTRPPQDLFDEAVRWLAQEYGQ